MIRSVGPTSVPETRRPRAPLCVASCASETLAAFRCAQGPVRISSVSAEKGMNSVTMGMTL